jgi:anti-sigma factor RsiW
MLGAKHHNASLPRDLTEIARRLGEELNLAVLAPNLEAQGFDLLGADKCGIRGRPGAHLLYHSIATDELLSVFTVGRWEQLDAGLSIEKSARLAEGDVLASSGDEFQVVAWHEGTCTHALCGPFSRRQLVDLATQMRIASVGFRTVPGSASPLLAHGP